MKNLFVPVFILILVLFSSCKKEDAMDPGIVYDIDGNAYHTVTIGTQVWMVENLRTTRYNDGTDIPLVTDKTAWSNLTTPGYCWYNNDQASYGNTYGALYNWYTVNSDKLCPKGWHVPGYDEWTSLIAHLGGEHTAGGKLKAVDTTHWQSPNYGANNESGFTALPGGFRGGKNSGSFAFMGNYCYMWDADEYIETAAMLHGMTYDKIFFTWGFITKEYGLSVRCIRDK